jgi:hypothetical protein
MTHILVLGTSEPQDFQLTDDDLPLVGTSLTLGIQFRTSGLSAAKVAAIAALTTAWISQAAGTVRLSSTEGLPVGEYHFRWSLTDTGGKVGYIPNLDASPNILRVVKV